MLVWGFLLLAASSAADEPHVLTVEHRFSGIVCAGVCIDSELTVRSDGLATFRVRPASLKYRPWRTRQYRLSQEQVREFWRAYAPVRPVGLKGPIGLCDPDTLVIDWDIRWQVSGKPAR